MTDEAAKIAADLSPLERELMLMFSRHDLVEAETLEEARAIHTAMEKGLVSYIHIAGRVYAECRLFGLAVRTHLERQSDD